MACGSSGLGLLCLEATCQNSWNPWIGQRIGEASNPGPASRRNPLTVLSYNLGSWDNWGESALEMAESTHADVALLQEHFLLVARRRKMTQILRERGWNAYFGKKRVVTGSSRIHRRRSSASLGDVEGSPVVALRLADDRLLRICNIYANSGVGAAIEQDRNAYFAKVAEWPALPGDLWLCGGD